MSSGQEIERKFLINGDVPLELGDYPCEPISQGYISIDSNGTEVRLRAKGGRHTLGVKSGPSRTRVEEEIERSTGAALSPCGRSAKVAGSRNGGTRLRLMAERIA